MLELNNKEMIIFYSTIGFVLGAVLTITEYALLFPALDRTFSFQVIIQLHEKLPVLYLIDFIALPGALFGAWIANWRFNQLDSLSRRIRLKTDNNEAKH